SGAGTRAHDCRSPAHSRSASLRRWYRARRIRSATGADRICRLARRLRNTRAMARGRTACCPRARRPRSVRSRDRTREPCRSGETCRRCPGGTGHKESDQRIRFGPGLSAPAPSPKESARVRTGARRRPSEHRIAADARRAFASLELSHATGKLATWDGGCPINGVEPLSLERAVGKRGDWWTRWDSKKQSPLKPCKLFVLSRARTALPSQSAASWHVYGTRLRHGGVL